MYICVCMHEIATVFEKNRRLGFFILIAVCDAAIGVIKSSGEDVPLFKFVLKARLLSVYVWLFCAFVL